MFLYAPDPIRCTILHSQFRLAYSSIYRFTLSATPSPIGTTLV